MRDYALYRSALGWLFVYQLLWLTPSFRTFAGRYHSGAWRSSRAVTALLYVTWLCAALALATGRQTLIAAAGLFVVCRWLFVDSRWRGIFFGGSAVGYITYFVASTLLCFELAAAVSPSLWVDVAFVLRWQYGLLLACAGAYKFCTGYLFGEGIEYGFVNPAWGHLHTWMRRIPPHSGWWRAVSVTGALGELVAGVLFLVPIPAANAVAVALTLFIFSGIFMTIRVAQLAPAMILTALFLFRIAYSSEPVDAPPVQGALAIALQDALYIYVGALILTKIVQYLNLFLYRPVPEPLQTVVTLVTELVPFPMMRVFMPDFSNFFVRITAFDDRGRARTIVHETTTYSYRRWCAPVRKLRYLHACESITLASIFIGLKSEHAAPGQFRADLCAYARTVVARDERNVQFQLVAIEKTPARFELRTLCDFHVDLDAGTVREHLHTDSPRHRQRSPYSPHREYLGFGWHWAIDPTGRAETLPWLLRAFAKAHHLPPTPDRSSA